MLISNEAIKCLTESLAFEFFNSLIHYINSIDEEYHIIIKQRDRTIMIEKSHEEHQTVSLV